ncbi:hypothetical protein D7Z94_02095 [Ulvibacterium marinum]|uniref:Uncharacterized protein n=2 Tax=Ulvibacterium marinum TaxID=2419782 RepID=A0A3B0CHB3_9FLAO|nr:hypothetical protein D7Z94_02095 [Ulvibacterium marinum]
METSYLLVKPMKNKTSLFFQFLFRSKRSIMVLIPSVFLLLCCKEPDTKDQVATISLWYGTEQSFGNIGHPQAQINVLGNIQTDSVGITTYYMLNDTQEKHVLTLGSDLHRLAAHGDFNIEIYRDRLKKGKNLVSIYVAKDKTVLASKEITLNYNPETEWPLPYSVNWAEVKDILDVVQVVDGHWKITPQGIRTQDVYYDRVLAMGDTSWRNYEVTTTVTFHGYTPPEEGPPTYNVSHAALATLWPGHDKDSLQPNRKWHPLGATAEFRITDGYKDCRWRIFDGDNFYAEQKEDKYRNIEEGLPYKMKHRVQDLTDNSVRYSVKLWDASREEPEEWDFQAIETSKTKHLGGSCLLIAHNTDVTFGNVDIIPLKEMATLVD